MRYANVRVLSVLILILFLMLAIPPTDAQVIKGKLVAWGGKALKGIGTFLGLYGAEKVLDNTLHNDSDDDDGCYGSCDCSPHGSCHSGCDCPSPPASDPSTYGNGASNYYGSMYGSNYGSQYGSY